MALVVAIVGFAALWFAPSAQSQSAVELPLSREVAENLAPKDLAEVMFVALPEAVLFGRPDYVDGDNVFGATFLMRAKPAVDGYIVRFNGLCSLRRVRLSLDAAGDQDRVDDIETDTVYAVVGPASIIPQVDSASYMPGDIDQAADAIEKACDAFDRPDDVVESDSASSLMYATIVLSNLSTLTTDGSAKIECEDIKNACSADVAKSIQSARLQTVGICDDPDLSQALDIPSDHICVVIDLLVRGNRFQEEGWNIVAAGPWPGLDTAFVANRVFIRPTQTIID